MSAKDVASIEQATLAAVAPDTVEAREGWPMPRSRGAWRGSFCRWKPATLPRRRCTGARASKPRGLICTGAAP